MRSNLRLKLLGLCAMVLGLMAFGAGTAQAEAGANWKIEGNNVTSGLLPTIEIIEIEELELLPTDKGKHVVLLTEIGTTEVKILCTFGELTGAKLETEGKVTNGGKVKFTGCMTYLDGLLSGPCEPSSAGQPGGTVLTNAGKGLLGLFGGKKLTRIEPSTGENFAVITFGEECSLPEAVPVKGSIFIKDCINVEASTAKHLIEIDNAASHIFVISDTPEHKVELHGSAIVELGGAHKGLKWSGVPG